MKSGYFHRAIGDLRKRLTAAVPHDVLRTLHQKSPTRHFAVALRQLVLFASALALGWHFESLWVRVPCALVLGFVVFDGTVLLHEVVHKAVFDGDRPRAYRLLGLVYALPSGISPAQFTRWHLDHHAELGPDCWICLYWLRDDSILRCRQIFEGTSGILGGYP